MALAIVDEHAKGRSQWQTCLCYGVENYAILNILTLLIFTLRLGIVMPLPMLSIVTLVVDS